MGELTPKILLKFKNVCHHERGIKRVQGGLVPFSVDCGLWAEKWAALAVISSILRNIKDYNSKQRVIIPSNCLKTRYISPATLADRS